MSRPKRKLNKEEVEIKQDMIYYNIQHVKGLIKKCKKRKAFIDATIKKHNLKLKEFKRYLNEHDYKYNVMA